MTAPTQAPDELLDLLTPEEVAEILKVSERTLATMRVTETGPPCRRVGGAWRYPRLALSRWIGSDLRGRAS